MRGGKPTFKPADHFEGQVCRLGELRLREPARAAALSQAPCEYFLSSTPFPTPAVAAGQRGALELRVLIQRKEVSVIGLDRRKGVSGRGHHGDLVPSRCSGSMVAATSVDLCGALRPQSGSMSASWS
jgi:hypothetical protein